MPVWVGERHWSFKLVKFPIWSVKVFDLYKRLEWLWVKLINERGKFDHNVIKELTSSSLKIIWENSWSSNDNAMFSCYSSHHCVLVIHAPQLRSQLQNMAVKLKQVMKSHLLFKEFCFSICWERRCLVSGKEWLMKTISDLIYVRILINNILLIK